MSQSASLTLAGLRRGVRIAVPFAGSSAIYGLAFGLLANQTGLSVAEAVAMSALVFSGTAQIAVMQSWATHPSLLAIAVTVFIVNLRYILMGASLRPWLGTLSTTKSTAALLSIVDGSYALGMREHAKGDTDAGVLTGAGYISLAAWVIATGLGFFMGTLVPNPKAVGLDFVIIAFCASSAALMLTATRDYLPGLVAIAAALACEWVAPGPWSVVVAAISAAVTGAMRYKAAPSASEPEARA